MAKYADLEPIIKRLTSICLTDDSFGMGVQTGINHAMEIIGEARIVDAVEVVRCKDCKHYNKDSLWCNINSDQFTESHYNWYADDFCSYGERRTE